MIKKIESLNDVYLLQRDLNDIIKWSKDNNMQLHEDKFEFIQHNIPNTDKNLLLELPFVAYEQYYTTPNGNILEPAYQVKDLGVLITPNVP